MNYRPARIEIIAWQGRRLRDGHRPNSLSIALAAALALSATLLVLHFSLGLPAPLPLLQVAFAVGVCSAAWLVTRAAVNLLLRLQAH